MTQPEHSVDSRINWPSYLSVPLTICVLAWCAGCGPVVTPQPIKSPAKPVFVVAPPKPVTKSPVIATPPRPMQALSDTQLTEILIGAWRRFEPQGLDATIQFESNGTCSYYSSSSNPAKNLLAGSGGRLHGRWTVRSGMLGLEWSGGDNQIVDLFARGSAARTPIRILDANTVQLSGIEMDTVVRTYQRIR